MSYEPVEGVHYIFDRYAFLNSIMKDGNHQEAIEIFDPQNPDQKEVLQELLQITPDSAPDKMKKIIRLARAMYHPDRQSRSGEKMQREAERMSGLIDDCERFLTNPDLKPHYDAKLASFKKDNPEMVSASGTAIIDPMAEMLDINSLLSDDVLDTRDFEDRVKALVQYDEKEAGQVKSLFDSMPDNGQIRSLYKSALNKKLVYLNLLEDAAWAKIGVLNKKQKTQGHLLSSEDYLAEIEASLKTIATTELDKEIERRGDSYRIGMARLPLLLTFNPAAGSQQPSTGLMDPAQMQEVMDKMKVRARQNLEIRAEYARDIARQKQDVMGTLMTLTPVTAINNHNENSPLYSFYLVNSVEDDAMVMLRLDLDASTAQSTVATVFDGALNVSDLKRQTFDRNAFMVERNAEISDILIEVSAAAERTYQQNKSRFAKPEPDTPPAAPQP